MKDKGRAKESWLDRVFLKSFRPYLWLVGIGFLLYSKALFFGFSFLDDNVLILQNYGFIGDLSNFLQAFRQDVFGALQNADAYYRPLLTVSLMLDARLGGALPFIYHFSNVIIHLLAVCLLFVLLTKLEYGRGPVFFFSLLFTAHPVLTQAVAWIPGRNDSLLAVFIFASFIFFLNYSRSKKWSDHFWYLLFLILAFFTKETALVMILPVFLYLHLIKKEKFFSYNDKIFFAGWIIISVIWFFLRLAALTHPLYAGTWVIVMAMFQNLPVFIQYTGKMFFPLNLSTLPVIRDTTLVYGLLALTLLAVLLLASQNRRNNYVLFGLSWFVIFILPTLFFYNPADASGTNFHLEHRTYLAFIGIIIVLLETDLFKGFDLKRLKYALPATLVLLLFAGLTFSHLEDFRDRLHFWANAARTSPHSPLAHRNLGAMYYLDGQPDKAEPEYQKALELNPQEPMAHNNLGLIYMARGRFKAAEAEYNKELEINPDYDNALFNLGLLYAREGRFKDARALWEKTLAVSPGYDDARKYLRLIDGR
jgi:hypothetical protein